MSKIDQAALNLAEAERKHDIALEASRTAQKAEQQAFDRLLDARGAFGKVGEEKVEKAREYIAAADTAAEAPEEDCEKSCAPDDDQEDFEVDLGEVQLMPPVPHIAIHIHSPERPASNAPALTGAAKAFHP